MDDHAAIDLLWLNGRDLRQLPLTRRKKARSDLDTSIGNDLRLRKTNEVHRPLGLPSSIVGFLLT